MGGGGGLGGGRWSAGGGKGGLGGHYCFAGGKLIKMFFLQINFLVILNSLIFAENGNYDQNW